VRVDKSFVTLQNGRELEYGVIVWSTGVAPRKITSTLDASVFVKDGGGRLVTDPWLRVRRHDVSAPGGEARASRAA
jgi:NADH dehydrogenase FAD-containing subunit